MQYCEDGGILLSLTPVPMFFLVIVLCVNSGRNCVALSDKKAPRRGALSRLSIDLIKGWGGVMLVLELVLRHCVLLGTRNQSLSLLYRLR